jgi:hypothetical protein
MTYPPPQVVPPQSSPSRGRCARLAFTSSYNGRDVVEIDVADDCWLRDTGLQFEAMHVVVGKVRWEIGVLVHGV